MTRKLTESNRLTIITTQNNLPWFTPVDRDILLKTKTIMQ